jgi:hypothetical protein
MGLLLFVTLQLDLDHREWVEVHCQGTPPPARFHHSMTGGLPRPSPPAVGLCR